MNIAGGRLGDMSAALAEDARTSVLTTVMGAMLLRQIPEDFHLFRIRSSISSSFSLILHSHRLIIWSGNPLPAGSASSSVVASVCNWCRGLGRVRDEIATGC